MAENIHELSYVRMREFEYFSGRFFFTMKIKFLPLLVLVYGFKVQAQTSVSGTLTQSTEWTLAGSPYTLTGTLGVPSGVTLTIDAGVQVSGSFDLLVKGSIQINGTTGQPVTFQNTRL